MRVAVAVLPLLASLISATSPQPFVNQDGNPVNALAMPLFRQLSCMMWPSDPSCSQQDASKLMFQNSDDNEHQQPTDSGDRQDEDGLNVERKRYGWVYLIRHGEKVKHSERTGLSARGVRRARCLRNVFGRKGRKIDLILAQDFRPNGKRRRPYETVKPLADALDIPLDHTCDRDDYRCAAKKIKRHARSGENILVVWEHARLTDIAERLGITGLRYPDDRYDVVFKIRKGKVHAIYSEECDGLDEEWFDWHDKKKGKHGKGGQGGRLIDDESWAEDVPEEPEMHK